MHRELNCVWDQVHGIHLPIMELKLKIFQLFKLVTHNRAMYNSMVRQASQSVVISRIAQSLSPWSPEAWATWCKEEVDLPSTTARRTAAVRLKNWNLLKRPAAVSRTKPFRKRTAFTKKTGFKTLLQEQAALKRKRPRKRVRKS